MNRLAALSTHIRSVLNVGGDIDGISPPPVPRCAWKETDLPYITLRMVRGDEEEDMEGPDGYYSSIFQIEPWHRSYDVADDMRETIKANLLNYSGPAGDLKIAGVNHFGDHQLYDGDREVHCCLTRYIVVWVK